MKKSFTLVSESYKNNQDFGKLQIEELCKVLNMEIISPPSYGYARANYKGHEVNLNMRRNINRIDMYSSDFRSGNHLVKSLSEIQVKNLLKKFDEEINDMHDREKKVNTRNEIGKKLGAFGVNVYNGYIIFKSEKFYVNSDLSPNYKASFDYEFYFDSDTKESDARDKLDNCLENFLESRAKYKALCAELRIHEKLIADYYKLL